MTVNAILLTIFIILMVLDYLVIKKFYRGPSLKNAVYSCLAETTMVGIFIAFFMKEPITIITAMIVFAIVWCYMFYKRFPYLLKNKNDEDEDEDE